MHVCIKSQPGPSVFGAAHFIVYYRPKKTDQTWPGTHFNEFLDPNDYDVLYDQILTPQLGSIQGQAFMIAKSFVVSLRGIVTTYDSLPRKNNLKIAIIQENDGTTAWSRCTLHAQVSKCIKII